jgi:hypothetical protein
MAEKPNILIAVPAYGGNIRTDCALSLVALAAELTRRSILFSTLSIDNTDIVDSRNFLASLAASSNATHVLLSDNDMVFSPPAILKMLKADKDVIACAVPQRRADATPTFNFVPLNSKPVGDIAPVKRIGTGLMLVKISALRLMRETGKLREQRKNGLITSYGGPIFGYFDKIDLEGDYLGEDYSFCERWRSICGGEIFALLSEPIGHVGTIMYRAKYS